MRTLDLKKIHATLQALDPSALVLLGGSNLYGEADNSSDVDFYIIFPIWRLPYFYKKKLEKIKSQLQVLSARVMIVPQFFFKHGWYYIYGVDINGKIYRSAIHRRLNVAQGLKFAYFYFIKLIAAKTNNSRRVNAYKVAQKIALTILTLVTNQRQAETTDLKNIINYCSKFDLLGIEIITDVLECRLRRQKITTQKINLILKQGPEILAALTKRCKSHLRFSLSNYFIYNAKFLLHCNPLFLCTNPDKLVMQKMISGLMKKDRLGELYEEIKEIIFPVIII